jgi:hypothetical protein
MRGLRRVRITYFSQPPHKEKTTLNTASQVKVKRSYLKVGVQGLQMWIAKEHKGNCAVYYMYVTFSS